MKPPLYLISALLLLLATTFLEAQQDAIPVAQNGPVLGLHIMPLSMTNYKARYRAGAMVQFRRMALVLDLEYGDRYTLNWLRSSGNDTNLFYGVRPEIRLRFPTTYNPERPNDGVYTALEFPVTYTERTLLERSYNDDDGQRRYFDRANKARTRATVVLKAGYVFFIGERLYLDVYGGMGGGIRIISYNNVVGDRPGPSAGDGWFPAFDTVDEVGTTRVMDLSLGFRVGYAF